MSDPLTREEAARLMEVAGQIGRSFSSSRDQAALTLMYRCGLRSNEARMLDFRDLRETDRGRSVRVRFPKGWNRKRSPAQPREVGLDEQTNEALGRWIAERGEAEGPLFVTQNGNRVCTSQWRRKIKPAARAAHIDRRVHCHGLRHTFARELHDEDVSVRLIRDALGHASLQTTDTYLDSLGSPEVVAYTSERR